jgi:hypothetical protein
MCFNFIVFFFHFRNLIDATTGAQFIRFSNVITVTDIYNSPKLATRLL